MPVGELLQRMTSQELTEWQAYERVAGLLGPERDDRLMAVQTYHLLIGLGVKKHKVRMDRLLPRWDRAPQPWQQMRDMARAMTEQMGGTVHPPGG